MNVDEVATPLELVTAVVVAVPFAKVPLAPVAGAVKVTVTPLVGTPPVVTVAPSLVANAVLTVAVCGVPLVAAMATTGAAVLVRLKLAEVVAPGADAETVNVPAVAFAVKVEAVATPLEFVTAVVVAVPFAKVPLAPVAGAVKVTVTPLVGVPPVVTVAPS